uniref:Uncharacterized protein n=1 Tax=Musa acuminata subsp. malaccensis TaxID=214687 RepID=A0A804J4P1_MUSAM
MAKNIALQILWSCYGKRDDIWTNVLSKKE